VTLADALARLTHRLAVATDDQADDVATILRLGAGDLGLPAGAVPSAPAGLVPARRMAWLTLVDALRFTVRARARLEGRAPPDDDAGRDDADWTPVRAGDWESVLTTLVIEREWDTIADTADDLRADHADTPAAPWEPPEHGVLREVIDLLSQTQHTFRSRQIQRARERLETLLVRPVRPPRDPARRLRRQIAAAGAAPLTDDQAAELVAAIRRDDRQTYEDLCAAWGIVNAAETWTATRARIARAE
jgi:hypothetical protein